MVVLILFLSIWHQVDIAGEQQLPHLRNTPLSSLLQPMQVRFQRNENSFKENLSTQISLTQSQMFAQSGVLDCPAVFAGFLSSDWLLCVLHAAMVDISPILTRGGSTMQRVLLHVDVLVESFYELEEKRLNVAQIRFLGPYIIFLLLCVLLAAMVGILLISTLGGSTMQRVLLHVDVLVGSFFR